MTHITGLGSTMQAILHEKANRLARRTGFIQRQRQITGATFVQSLVFTWLNDPQASLAALTRTAAVLGLDLTPQSLQERFNDRAAAFLEAVLACATEALIRGANVEIEVLSRFEGVYVIDTSIVGLPPSLAQRWAGVGGSTPEAGRAALKLEVMLDLCDGHLSGPLLWPGRRHDQAGALAGSTLPAGALCLADLGYFSLDRFRHMQAEGQFWISRLKASCGLVDVTGRRFDVLDRLERATAAGHVRFEEAIRLGVRHQLPCRLLAQRVPESIANERRRKLRRRMIKHGRTPTKRSLALCAWTLVVTNVPGERLSFEEAMALLRARWQIELLFKLWKSHGGLAQSRSENPWRILCELYAKLLAMLVVHWILLVGLWRRPEKSLLKGAQTISAHALHLAASLHSQVRLCRALNVVVHVLDVCCSIESRRKHPSTYQRLINANICELT